MTRKTAFKLFIDLLMTVLMLVAMAYTLTGNLLHELSGVSLLVLLLVHNAVNLRWYPAIPKGRYDAVRRIDTAITLSLCVVMPALLVSGVFLSRDVFAALGLKGGLSAQKLHILTAYWGLILMSAHIGMHWEMIMGALRKATRTAPMNRSRVLLLRVAGTAAALYGAYAFFKREFGPKLLLQNTFDFWNYDEPVVFFFIDYIAVMGLCVWIVHYIRKFIQNRKRQSPGAPRNPLDVE